MTDNVKIFLEEVERNKELKEKLEQRDDYEVSELIALAKEYGYVITEDDLNPKNFTEEELEVVNAMEEDDELSLDELEGVAGGMKIVVIKSPKFISPILRFIFKIKKEQK